MGFFNAGQHAKSGAKIGFSAGATYGLLTTWNPLGALVGGMMGMALGAGGGGLHGAMTPDIRHAYDPRQLGYGGQYGGYTANAQAQATPGYNPQMTAPYGNQQMPNTLFGPQQQQPGRGGFWAGVGTAALMMMAPGLLLGHGLGGFGYPMYGMGYPFMPSMNPGFNWWAGLY